jgi:hypothetical protein
MGASTLYKVGAPLIEELGFWHTCGSLMNQKKEYSEVGKKIWVYC